MNIKEMSERYMQLCVEKRKVEERIFDAKMQVVKELVKNGDIDFLDVNWSRICRVHRVTPLKYMK